jgi:nitric oxide reductase subunit C
VSRIVFFLSLFGAFLLYSLFVYTRGTRIGEPAMNAAAVHGKQLFQQHNCTACHQVYGLGGYLGPELTTVISRKDKGEAYVRAILKTGTARMPDFHLTDAETGDLVEYLRHIDRTATATSIPTVYGNK